MSIAEAAVPPRRTALVTGASRGIGAELARLLAGAGYDLVLVSRGAEAGQKGLAGDSGLDRVSVRCYNKDLSAPGGAAALWSELSQAGIAVDILVNNAGSGLYGPLAEQDTAALEAMIDLNVNSLTALTRLALPRMLARRWGRILNVASIVAYQPGGPRMAAYYATKAYVLSLSRGLSRELRGSGVTVTALCPGPIRTAFEERSGAARALVYRWFAADSPTAAAEAGFRGLMRGRRVVIPGLLPKIIALAGELSPRTIALEVNRFLLEKR
jgi:short-subunit dehydrogenase